MATPKYRPSLTSSQITLLLELLQGTEQSREVKQLTATLSVFAHKVSVGINHPSYVESGTQSIASKMGFSEGEDDIVSLYQSWITSPKSIYTASQLSRIREYRYINDLMLQEEEIEYENSLITPILKA